MQDSNLGLKVKGLYMTDQQAIVHHFTHKVVRMLTEQMRFWVHPFTCIMVTGEKAVGACSQYHLPPSTKQVKKMLEGLSPRPSTRIGFNGTQASVEL